MSQENLKAGVFSVLRVITSSGASLAAAKSERRNITLALSGLVVFASCAMATPITWALQDVVFTSGAVTGTFTYDADVSRGNDSEIIQGAVISANLDTPDGETYQSGDGEYIPLGPEFVFTGGPDVLRIFLATDLTDAGGIVNITSVTEDVCVTQNCDEFYVANTTSSGEVLSQPDTPEPVSLVLAGLGLLAVFLVLRRDHLKRVFKKREEQ